MYVDIIADIHCHNHDQFSRILPSGINSRLQDAIDALEALCVPSAKDRVLIVAGDIAHSRKSIDHAVLEKVFEAFVKLRQAYSWVYVITGNHDLSLAGEGAFVSILEGENCTVVQRGSSLVKALDGTRFGFLPYTEDQSFLEKHIDSFAKQKVEYVIGHLGVLGGLSGPSSYEIPGRFPPEAVIRKGFKHVFIGHYHKHQTFPRHPVTYVGSLLQTTAEEALEDKGFVRLNTATGKWKFIENTSSPRFKVIRDVTDAKDLRKSDFVTVRYGEGDDLEAIEEALADREDIRYKKDREATKMEQRILVTGKSDRDILKTFATEVSPPTFLKDYEDSEHESINNQLLEKGVEFLARALE